MALTKEQRARRTEIERRRRHRMSDEAKAASAQRAKDKRAAIKQQVIDIEAIPVEDWTDEQRSIMDKEDVRRKRATVYALMLRDKNRDKFRRYMREYMREYYANHINEDQLAAREERRLRKEAKAEAEALGTNPKKKLGSTWAYKKAWLAKRAAATPKAPTPKPPDISLEEGLDAIRQKHAARREKNRQYYLDRKAKAAETESE